MKEIFGYSAIIAISIVLLSLSLAFVWATINLVRDSTLNGLPFDNLRAFFVARRLKLRYKGTVAYATVVNGERKVFARFHGFGGCRTYLYRGIVTVAKLVCESGEYVLGDSVTYCPKCEKVVGLISDESPFYPEESMKRGPLGIVK